MAQVQTRHSGLAAGAVANLLGISGGYKGGGFKPTSGPTTPTLFTPERWDEIINYITTEPSATPLGQVAAGIASPEALTSAWNQYQGGAGALGQALTEGLQTGYETNIAPLAAAYKRQFERETIPGLAEQFAGTSGLSSSDFGRSVAEAGADLATNLGALEFGAKESAAARRAQMVGMAPEIQQSMLATPTGYAADLLALGEEMQPGKKLLDTFLSLAGIDTGGQTVVKQPSSGAGGVLSGVGDVLGGIFS